MPNAEAMMPALVLLAIRGPHEKRYTWFGWREGHDLVKRRPTKPAQAPDAAMPLPPMTKEEPAGQEEEKTTSVAEKV